METWRLKAKEMFPEFEEYLAEVERPMSLWIELRLAFEGAYDAVPRDEDLIRRIYEYAFWCVEQGERQEKAAYDPPTCVAVAFYEHIPEHPLAREDMPRWFSRQEVLGMKELFSYLIGDEGYLQLLELFPTNPSSRKTRRARRKRQQGAG